MLKKGYYTIYNGKEYRLNWNATNQMYIYTSDKNLIDETFIENPKDSKMYKKLIQPFELDDLYHITPAVYVDGNRRLGVRKEKDDMVLVFTNGEDEDLIEKYHLKEVDRYVYEGWISKNEVQLVEERKDMTCQFGVIKKPRNTQ